MDTDSPLSGTKVFQEIKKLVQDSDDWFAKNLKFYSDVYKHLADEAYLDIYWDEPFAILEVNGGDGGFSFSLTLYEYYFELTIDELEPIWMYFDTGSFENEKEAAKYLYKITVMLASGQLSLLKTYRNDKLCASELLLEKAKGGQAKVALLQPQPSGFKGREKNANYTCALLRNSYTKKRSRMAESMLIFDSEQMPVLRKHVSLNSPTPITKKEYKKDSDMRIFASAGMKDSYDLALFKYWELYFVAVVYATLGIVAWNMGLIPQFMLDHVAFLTIPGLFICSFVTMLLLMWKEDLRKKKPGSIFLKFGGEISPQIIKVPYFIILLGTFVSLFIPNVIEKTTGEPISIFALSAQYPVGYLLVPLLGASFLVLFGKNKLMKIAGGISYLIGNVGIWMVAFNFTDVEKDVPVINALLTFPPLIFGLIATFIYLCVLVFHETKS